MTTKPDRLAEIRSAHNGANPDRVWYSLVSGPDTYWLICEVERLQANPDIEKLRAAWSAVKESWWQGDSEQAIAYMEMDLLLGVDADGNVVSPSL